MTERRIIKGVHSLALDGRRLIRKTDILIERGTIRALGGVDTDGAMLTDARGVMIPGLIQAYAHLDHALMDRGVVPSVDPALFHKVQLRAWREGVQGDAARVQTLIGLGQGLRAGALGCVDAAPAEPSISLQVAAALGVRYAACLPASMGLERRLESMQEQLETAGGQVQLAVWLGDPAEHSMSKLRSTAALAQSKGLALVAQLGLRPHDRGLRKLERAGALFERTLLCHGSGRSLQDPSSASMLAQAGASLVLTPTYDILRGAPSPPLDRLLAAKVNLALGSASAATRLGFNLFREMRCLSRALKAHTDQPASTALEIATRGGAQAIFKNAGSIEVGRSADLLLIDVETYDGESHEALAQRVVEQGAPARIRYAWAGGQVILSEGRAVGAPLPSASSQDAVRDALVARVDEALESPRGRFWAWVGRAGRPWRRSQGWHER